MNKSHTRGLLVLLLAQALALGPAVASSAGPPRGTARLCQDSPTLEVGKSLRGEFKSNEEHAYGIKLGAGQFFRVLIEQRGVDVVLMLYGPDGRLLTEADSPNSSRGPESIMFVTDAGGLYRLVVRPLRGAEAVGEYEVKLVELRAATELDGARVAAQRAFAEGGNLFAAGKLQQSLERYEQALRLYRATGDGSGEAATLNLIGLIYYRTGESEKARTYLEQALSLHRTAGDRRDEAFTLNYIGRIYYEQGQMQRALEKLITALTLFRDVRDRGSEAATLSNLGAVYNQLGEKQKALEIYGQALVLRRAVDDRRGEAVTLNNIGNVYNDLGETRKALDHFARAEALYRTAGDITAEAVTLGNVCSVYGILGETEKALNYCVRSVELMRRSGDSAGEAAGLSKLGTLRSKQGDKQQAIAHFSQALALFQKLGDRSGEAVALNNVGLLHSDRGEKQQALDYHAQALRLIRQIGDRASEGTTLNNLGKVYADLGEFQKALDHHLEALRIEREIAAVESEAATLANIGAAYEGLRDSAKALEYYLQTIAARERLRPEAVSKGRGLSFNAESAGVYERAALLYLGADRPEMAFDLSEKMRARSLLDQLAGRVGVTLTVAEVQKLLNPETTLLSYMVTADRTVAFVISANTFQVVQIPVKEGELFDLVRRFRSFPTLNTWRTDELHRLHQYLVAPVERHLKTPLIGIVPHGPLHYLPFSALSDGSRYFDEGHTIYYLPSASVIPHITNRRKRNDSLLAVSYSRAAGMPPLPFADVEAKAIGSIYRGSVLTGLEATERRVRDLAGDYGILHLAARYELNTESPPLSRLILAPGKNDDGFLEVREVYNLTLRRTDLVVLSGSQTQLGRQTGGNDFVAPSYAFIRAGASTVVGSLWNVDDKVTERLMVSFYKHLKGGAAKADALRKAQAETRLDYPNPYYWGAFVLTGDPGSPVKTKAAQ